MITIREYTAHPFTESVPLSESDSLATPTDSHAVSKSEDSLFTSSSTWSSLIEN